MKWELTGGDTAAYVVWDDPGETYIETGGTMFESSNGWGTYWTDGHAIGSLDGNWTMTGEITGSSGMTDWVAYSWDGTPIPLALVHGQRVRMEFVPGGNIDGEPDGFPSPLADGDDMNNMPDEDGVCRLTAVPTGTGRLRRPEMASILYPRRWEIAQEVEISAGRETRTTAP